MDKRLVVFGPGYCGAAVAYAARARGDRVDCVARDTDPAAARRVVGDATHIVSTVPPDGNGDPILQQYCADLHAAPRLRWVGYLSTTGVYGDRQGRWVDETTTPAPGSPRTVRRLAAEQGWAALVSRCPVDLFRLGGIYGPGRSAFDDLRAGRARRILKPGHAFGRIHRDDVVQALLAATQQIRPPVVRVLHLVDDLPAESAAVIGEAAHLLGVPSPPAAPFAEAAATLSPMARSFWAENRKVACRITQRALGIAWRHPTYREGLRAILAEERAQGLAQQG
ncbi:MAG TPA: SDR family NAD(P)-dependent oxidoreductase [Acetobacteraceae bacterium]|jgi:nucleoside-diphosphate-sugar epimerase|nr:SDR family NAD(P)-dependent oxidoreductase [Acetobacteraceae bacterium]